MNNELIAKVRRNIVAGVQSSARHVEKAARQGKLRWKLLAKKRLLNREFMELGQEAYMMLSEEADCDLSRRPATMDLRMSIDEFKRQIVRLEEQLEQSAAETSDTDTDSLDSEQEKVEASLA